MLLPLSPSQQRWGGTEVLLPCSSPGKVAFPLALTLVRECGHVSASRQPAQPEPGEQEARAGLFRQRLGTPLAEDSFGDMMTSVRSRRLQRPLGFEVGPVQLGAEAGGASRRWTSVNAARSKATACLLPCRSSP